MPRASTISTRTRCRAMSVAWCGLCLVLMSATTIRGEDSAVANAPRDNGSTAGNAARQADALGDSEEFFERRIRPMLAEHCFSCHGEKRQQAELRLDSAAGMRAGTGDTPVVVPGEPDKSRLIQVIRYSAIDYQMPPKGKLPEESIAMLEAWVRSGADWPTTESQADRIDATATTEEKTTIGGEKHWAFRPLARPEAPDVRNQDWPANEIDRFVLARLEREELSPSPPAKKRTLIRRAHFVLTGLPPSAEEIDAFVADDRSDSFAGLVDGLLASPHYGERWGRHWLDVARYADTKGYVFREERAYPDAWRYRDWVILAFNHDMPYDEFVKRQIAADRLAPDEADAEVALGFLTLGRRFLNNRHDIIDDRIDVVTRGLMGLTVACARCHDHKYDPIPTADYYSLYGVFASCEEPKEGPPLSLVDAK